MKKVRWGVISTAMIAQTQLIPAIIKASNAELVGIASNNEKVNKIASTFNIPNVYETYEALLQDPTIDAVYIPLPNDMHKEWVLKAADFGKHVLCEKPATLTAKEAIEIVSHCEKKNVKFMEAFMYQFHPQHKRVRDIISSGEIGEIRLMKSSHSFYLEDRKTNYRMDKMMGGGSLYDLGCYSIHSIRNLLRLEPVEVSVHADMDEQSGIDIAAYGFMKMEYGVKAMFDCSFDTVDRNEYEIIGTKGTITVPFAFRPDVRNGTIGIIRIQKGGEIREEKIEGDAYVLEVEHLSHAILKDEQPTQSGENTIRNMKIIDACFKSIKTGETIKLN